MRLTRRAAALAANTGNVNPSSDNIRRSTRARKPTKHYRDADSSWDEEYGEEEEEVVIPTRRSSRNINSRASESVAYRSEISSDESYYASEEEDEESQGTVEMKAEYKFSTVIASKTLTLSEWQDVTLKMNTSAIINGSRWHHGSNDNINESKKEERFLVKWSDLSHLHCSWERERDLVQACDGAKQKLGRFRSKSVEGLLYSVDERLDGDYFDPSWITVDRILNVHTDDEVSDDEEEHADDANRVFYIKWVNKNYSSNSYESEQDLILNGIEYIDQLAAYESRSKKPTKEDMKAKMEIRKAGIERLLQVFGPSATDELRESAIKEYQVNLEKKVYGNGGQLRDYQAEGVTWLVSNHINNRGSFLADEMGLGKTIQTACYVNEIAQNLGTRGPFLIIAPLSTIANWQREFSSWTNLNTVVYHGEKEDRVRIRYDEFAFPEDRVESNYGAVKNYLSKVQKKWRARWARTWMVEVVITTPELITADDFGELSSVEWELLVVDEAHRLKNHECKLADNLSRFQFKHRLLLSGTPIQNDSSEIWSLLHFIDPKTFSSLSAFQEQFGDLKKKEQVEGLHEIMRPYFLRRLKEVEESVPSKEETLIEVELTALQKQYYRALYEGNLKFLHRNRKKAADGPSLNNLAMQLRKCCNHPFLLNGVKEVISHDPNVNDIDLLVNSSGKLVLLDKLLPRLKLDGHRILLFSQFKNMLNIIQEYLELRGFKYERIDGNISGQKRQAAIDRFQSKNQVSNGSEPPLIMLISTRAGGVGINLTAADTCIIFDSDPNPQNDLQAMARCHRIGQTKDVKIYRFLTRKTYEMIMFHNASIKMGLDQAVLQGIENTGGSKDAMSKEEVEKLLRNGAYDIFTEDKDGSGDKESNDFVAQDIDSILERRSTTIIHDSTGIKSTGGRFSKASFQCANEGEIAVDDPNFWAKVVGEPENEGDDNILPDNEKRKRATTNYAAMFEDFDDDFGLMTDDDDDDDDENGNESDASEYIDNGDGDQIDEGVNVLESLFQEVHISAPANPTDPLNQRIPMASETVLCNAAVHKLG